MAAKKEKTAKQVAAEEKVNSEKQRALDMALAGIEKQFGKGAIIRMGDRPVQNIQVIPTGCLDLDIALGVVLFIVGLVGSYLLVRFQRKKDEKTAQSAALPEQE